MRVEIDASGDNDPRHCHIVVDGVGVLVDLSDLAGPLSDPLVTKISWGPFGENYTPGGRISRKVMNNATSQVEVVKFADVAILGPYLAAYEKRLAEALGEP